MSKAATKALHGRSRTARPVHISPHLPISPHISTAGRGRRGLFTAGSCERAPCKPSAQAGGHGCNCCISAAPRLLLGCPSAAPRLQPSSTPQHLGSLSSASRYMPAVVFERDGEVGGARQKGDPKRLLLSHPRLCRERRPPLGRLSRLSESALATAPSTARSSRVLRTWRSQQSRRQERPIANAERQPSTLPR